MNSFSVLIRVCFLKHLSEPLRLSLDPFSILFTVEVRYVPALPGSFEFIWHLSIIVFSDEDDDGGAWLLDDDDAAWCADTAPLPANAGKSVEEIAGDAKMAASLAMENLNLNPPPTTVSARATFGSDFHHRGHGFYDALVCLIYSTLLHSDSQ